MSISLVGTLPSYLSRNIFSLFNSLEHWQLNNLHRQKLVAAPSTLLEKHLSECLRLVQTCIMCYVKGSKIDNSRSDHVLRMCLICQPYCVLRRQIKRAFNLIISRAV